MCRKLQGLPALRSSTCIPIHLYHLGNIRLLSLHIRFPIPVSRWTELHTKFNTSRNSPPSSARFICYRKFISHNSNIIPSYQLLLDEKKSSRCPSCGNYCISHQILHKKRKISTEYCCCLGELTGQGLGASFLFQLQLLDVIQYLLNVEQKHSVQGLWNNELLTEKLIMTNSSYSWGYTVEEQSYLHSGKQMWNDPELVQTPFCAITWGA